MGTRFQGLKSMGNSDLNTAITPFGVDEPTTGGSAETDALVAFLQDGALPLLAGLVVAVFLIYQFGPWFLARPAMAAPMPVPEHSVVVREPEPAQDCDQPLRMQRPWQMQQ